MTWFGLGTKMNGHHLFVHNQLFLCKFISFLYGHTFCLMRIENQSQDINVNAIKRCLNENDLNSGHYVELETPGSSLWSSLMNEMEIRIKYYLITHTVVGRWTNMIDIIIDDDLFLPIGHFFTFNLNWWKENDWKYQRKPNRQPISWAMPIIIIIIMNGGKQVMNYFSLCHCSDCYTSIIKLSTIYYIHCSRTEYWIWLKPNLKCKIHFLWHKQLSSSLFWSSSDIITTGNEIHPKTLHYMGHQLY